MKAFLAWVAVFAGLAGIVSVIYHLQLSSRPLRVVIAIDTSVKMKNALEDVRAFVNRIKGRRYTRFCLLTSATKVQDFGETVDLGPLNDPVTYFGFRELDKLVDNARYPEIDSADEIFFLTNALDTGPLEKLGRGNIVRLSPGYE
jgi:hypothetical protein